MKVVLAPNAFKGSLTALEAAQAMAKGIKKAMPDAVTELIPVADGGDGLVEVSMQSLDGTLIEKEVTGPLGKPVRASFCYIENKQTAIVEMALASGLALISESERNPLKATTFGTGELVREAIEMGAKKIIIGLGGSATVDGGTGMASALGIRFINNKGEEFVPTGGTLSEITDIDSSAFNKEITFEAVCDVDNPLLGPKGAAHVFAPQKGANNEEVDLLEQGLKNLADVVKAKNGMEVHEIPGAGAAGGFGAGLKAFFNAQLRPGTDVVLDLVNFHERIKGANLILTAEGQIDYQTAFGKAPAGVGRVAQSSGIPCLAFAGGVGKGCDQLRDCGIDAVFSICNRPMNLDEAMADAHELLLTQTEQVFRSFLCGKKK